MATANKQTPSSEIEETVIEMTFKLMESGEKEIQLKDQYKDLVLVVGDTGNGKTKFTGWITGDDAHLIAKETVEDTGEYIIDDIHGKSSSTITSDTVYPTLVVDIETNVPYYDCPGFNDSRSACNDIATAYFIKKIVDYSNSVKILFIINYPSVKRGVERHNFMQLLKHVTEFIKNVEKFQNSIALVATKVDNIYINRGKVFVDDNKVVSVIADFLEEVKQDVSVKVLDSSSMEKPFYDAALKLISCLLKKDGEQYANIGIFRKPDQSGPLSEIPLLLKGKENIKRIIYRNLTFTEKVDDDFGYTISLKSKNVIGRLVEEINKSVWNSVGHITDEITKHYSTLMNEMQRTIKSFGNVDSPPDADQLSAQKLSCDLREGCRGILNLIKDVESVTSPYDLAQKIKRFMVYLENFDSENYILNIENQGRRFDFLQVVSEEKLNTRSWDELFKRAETSMSDCRKKLQEDSDDVAPSIQKRIFSSFELISKDLQNQLDEKIKQLEVQEIPVKLTNYSDSVMCMVERSKNATSINEHLKIINDATRCININMPNDSALKIIKLKDSLKFLQNFSEKNYCALSSEWVHPFQNLVNHLNESKTWYGFSDSIYRTFSAYEIQKDKKKYNVADLGNWGKSNASRGIFITKTNFQHFIQKISEFNIADLENIKNIKLTETRIEELNQVLNLTLKKQMKMDIQLPSAFITGDYIRISDIMNDPEKGLLLKSETLKFAYIFASSTIFIDEDLTLPGLGFGIIAPKWEIIGDRKINLNGTDGEAHSRDKASDGIGFGSNGEDGEPGLPGSPGGTFFGIGESFVNGVHLTITANGGDGSPGQHGGNGQEGELGLNAQMPTSADSPCPCEIEQGITSIGGFSCEKIGGRGSIHTGLIGEGIFEAILISSFGIRSRADYRISGHSGGRGGDGGNGGKGGEGGNPGLINLYELNANSGMSTHFKGGICGRDGKGGGRGMGGVGGNHIIAQCHMFIPDDFLTTCGYEVITDWDLTARIENYDRGDAGRYGVDGANSRGSLSPEPANTIPEPFKIVNRYKKYLIENLNCRFKRSSLLSFLNKINEDNDIRSIYNTLGLIEEFQVVEQEHARSSLKQSLFLQIYQSLLNRISEYAEGMKSSEDESSMKVLKYLYTTILTRISILADKSQTYLITDIDRYLDMIKRDIEKLKELQTAGKKSSIISKHKEDYNCNVNKRIEEAQRFIMEQILPEFNIIKQQIDNNIHLLIVETINLQDDAKNEKDNLIMKRGELDDCLMQKQVFSSFKFIAKIVSFLVPVAVAAGSVIEVSTSVLESFALNKAETQNEPNPNATNILQLVQNGINNVTNGSLNFLNNLLGVISNEIKNYPEALQDLLPVIEGIQKQKNDTNEYSLGLMGIKTLENQLKLELKSKEEKMKPLVGDGKSKDALKRMIKLNKVAQFGSLIFDFESGDKIETAKLDELAKAIDRADKKFIFLKQYEENLYNSIAPMIKNMEDTLFDTATRMDSKSRIALGITKWQVQSSLKNVQLQMKELTQGFKLQDNIARCFDTLQEAMTTLIKVYDSIEYYREQKTLANYIADISSVAVNNINVSDQKLANALNHLDIALKSNLVLMHYKTALDAFNQWVFPLSQSYIEDSMLPYHLRFESDAESLASDCVVHIERMKMNVEAYKISVMGNDKYIHHGEFSSGNLSTQPFFVWKNQKYKYLISRLLSGEEIILKAEVRKSPVNKDAIKFNLIEFLFRCKTESLQSQLNQVLKSFDIMATHTGNSYYLYRNRIYLITSDKQTIFYSFEKNADGKSIRTNAVYDKIRRGDLMLSPYTVWQLKLVDSTGLSSFDELKIFKDDIDLELAGHGSYVMNFNQLHLADEDYRLVEVYDEFDRYLD
ncbi:hypothetical protein AVEN_123243-1 [Araneus ventricosus]|uniref:Uncharacterized protein n=1 Tax=Araneus ventricosus TaxID=182803 RepID=A0A4Y2KSZ5_ARAVE|nr:hypothetical protein AVEN_123243-1 [Araneus ventricosus]